MMGAMKCWFVLITSHFIMHRLGESYEIKKPNFLFILVDDLGYNDIGYNANDGSALETPFLDNLAKNGIILGNYYVHKVCTPSRGALLTGKYSIHTGLQHEVIKPSRPYGLPLHHELLPERLKQCGYDTYMVGKWHLGISRWAFTPWNRGFDSFSGILIGEENHFTRRQCHKGMCGYDWWTENGPSNNTYGEYSTHLYTRKVIEALDKQNSSKPFFLYLAYQAPHRPVQVPREYLKPFRRKIRSVHRRKYAAMVSVIDQSVKNITQYLQDKKLLDDTIIVFSTDNGGEPKEGGNNWPLRGRKGTLWEGGVKAVGFVHGKRLNKAGVKHTGLFHIVDWFPTFAKAANCTKDSDILLDGVNQWETLTSNVSSPRNEILHIIDHRWRKTKSTDNTNIFDTSIRAAIRVGPWKLITGDPGISDHTPPPESNLLPVVETSSLSLGAKLFNLEEDPNETRDVAKLFPNTTEELLRRLAFYESGTVPTVYEKSSKQANPALRDGYWGPWMD